MYGRSTSGTVIVPSSFWYISIMGMRMRGVAATVLLRLWQKTFLPSAFL